MKGPRPIARPLLAGRVVISLFIALAAVANAQSELEAAQALIAARQFPEARAALEKITATDPRNAAACHALGLVIKRRGDTPAFEEAVKWLAKAAQLEPQNPIYLGDFGGTSLQLAGRTRSFTAATQGRDAMEKAVALKPDYLDAREGLVQFYLRAPWPIGSNGKANAHLEEIRRRDPVRAMLLDVSTKLRAEDFAGAFKACEAVLAGAPADYTALYNFGRTAAISGQQLERGLALLKKCLELTPPTPASATHSHVWNRIGNVQEKLKRPAEARAAYEMALKLDSSNQPAADSLARLGK